MRRVSDDTSGLSSFSVSRKLVLWHAAAGVPDAEAVRSQGRITDPDLHA